MTLVLIERGLVYNPRYTLNLPVNFPGCMTFTLHKHFEAPWLLWSALKGKMCPCHRRGKVFQCCEMMRCEKNEEQKTWKMVNCLFSDSFKDIFLNLDPKNRAKN